MKETEILRGLHKAKKRMYADGVACAQHYATGTNDVRGTAPSNSPGIGGFLLDTAQRMTGTQPVIGGPAKIIPTPDRQREFAETGLRESAPAPLAEPAPEQAAFRFARGTRSVKGPKGRDKVPAMLTAGEAVLTPGAADAIGRANIAKANAMHKPSGGGLHAAMRQPVSLQHFAAGTDDVLPQSLTGTGDVPTASIAGDTLRAKQVVAPAAPNTPSVMAQAGDAAKGAYNTTRSGLGAAVDWAKGKMGMASAEPAAPAALPVTPATAPVAAPAAPADLSRGAQWAEQAKAAGRSVGRFVPKGTGGLIAPAAVGIEALTDGATNKFHDDPNVPFMDKAIDTARSGIAHGMGAVGAVLGAGAGSGVTPVAGTLAGGALGAAGGYRLGDQISALLGDPKGAYESEQAGKLAVAPSIPKRGLTTAATATTPVAEPAQAAPTVAAAPIAPTAQPSLASAPGYSSDPYRLPAADNAEINQLQRDAQQLASNGLRTITAADAQQPANNGLRTVSIADTRPNNFSSNGNRFEFPTATTHGMPSTALQMRAALQPSLQNTAGIYGRAASLMGQGIANTRLALRSQNKEIQRQQWERSHELQRAQYLSGQRQLRGEQWDKNLMIAAGDKGKNGEAIQGENFAKYKDALTRMANTHNGTLSDVDPAQYEHLVNETKAHLAGQPSNLGTLMKSLIGKKPLVSANPLNNRAVSRDGMFVNRAGTGTELSAGATMPWTPIDQDLQDMENRQILNSARRK